MGSTFVPSAVVLMTGIFWGVYWVPVRAVAEVGLDGAWGTAAIEPPRIFWRPISPCYATISNVFKFA
jgi:hypothetical protein